MPKKLDYEKILKIVQNYLKKHKNSTVEQISNGTGQEIKRIRTVLSVYPYLFKKKKFKPPFLYEINNESLCGQ